MRNSPPKELELAHSTDVEQYQYDNKISLWHVICQVPFPLGTPQAGLMLKGRRSLEREVSLEIDGARGSVPPSQGSIAAHALPRAHALGFAASPFRGWDCGLSDNRMAVLFREVSVDPIARFAGHACSLVGGR